MTTWTMDQVWSVKRLWAELHVDTELVNRHGETVLREAEGEMAKRLKDMAHPLGVELALEPDHYVVEWQTPEDAPWSTVGRMSWHPQTRTVELRGGHCDGQRYEVTKVGEPIRVARPMRISPFAPAPDEPPTMSHLADTYELVGWREDSAVWVYEARRP